MAVALAQALLPGVWEHAELIRRAGTALGASPPWLGALVEELLVLFPVAPADRPRELDDAVSYSAVFQAGAALAREAGTPLRIVPPATSGARPPYPHWSLPELGDPQQLAAWLELSAGQLSWLADPGGFQLRTRPGPLHLYDYAWRARPGRAPRLLEAPTPILLRVQRELLHRLLDRIPVHPAAHGFVPGRSVLTHARRHLGAAVVVSVDLTDFFASVPPSRVAGILRSAGYPDEVARTLTGVFTTRTPAWVLSGMPRGGTSEERHRLRGRLRTPHLPQGAPSSPALANLVCYHLDRRLSGYAASVPAVFSRYADDLSFSGDARLRLSAPAFVRGVARIVANEGFSLNPSKTRVQAHGHRQLVTGLVVNERPNVSRRDHDRLRAVLHEARTQGPEVANRDGRPDFRRHLVGRVSWVESVNPARGRPLRSELEAIDWPDDPPP